MNEIPTQQEQDVAREYCLHRNLVRPKTNIKTAIICVLVFLMITIASTIGTNLLLLKFGISFTASPFINIIILWGLMTLLWLIILLKYIIIGLVHLYQHYAAENIRRRCLFMPTCSEYMILAIKKYGVIVGVYKGTNRLLFKCRGNIYRIDYP